MVALRTKRIAALAQLSGGEQQRIAVAIAHIQPAQTFAGG